MIGDPDRTAFALAGIAAEAGRFLAAVADRGAGRVDKADGSPSTAADVEAARIIMARLRAEFADVPVLCEESGLQGRASAEAFFLVDPLDGTRDFLAGDGEYSVNVALVARGRPVAAALAAPSLDRVWAAGDVARTAPMSAAARDAAWTPVFCRAAREGGLDVLVSRRHGDPETEICLGALPVARRLTVSSAAKFGLLASGEADLYVRCGPTMEWDIAAGDHIVTRAGGRVVLADGRIPTYGRADRGYRNGPFLACGDPATAKRVRLPVG